MARMHTRRRGKSSSTRPYRTSKPEWIEADRDKVSSLVIDLYHKGHSTSQIGILLRDVHGIPDVKSALGVSMYTMLEEKGEKMDLPEDIKNLMRRAVKLGAHLKDNHKDIHNKRALQLTEAKIRRLGRYYVRKGVLPEGWSYSLSKAKLLAD